MRGTINNLSYDEKLIRLRLKRIDAGIEEATSLGIEGEIKRLGWQRRRILEEHPWILPYEDR